MLDKKRVSEWGFKKSAVFNNSISSFKQASKYWGAKYFSGLHTTKHMWRITKHIIPNAKLVYEIGAKYTLLAVHINSSGTIVKRKSDGKVVKKIPNAGKYRCDTFVSASIPLVA